MSLYCRHLPLAAFLIVLVAFHSATAQESWILDDQDTWEKQKPADPTSSEGQLNEIRRAIARGDHERAENMATQWIERHRNDSLYSEALLLRGDSLFARGSYYKALFDYEEIARGHSGSEAFVSALERELQIAVKYADGLKRQFWGMRVLDASDEAEELLIRVQERLPGSQLAEEAGMELADFYFRNSEMPLAVEAYTLFIENYPSSAHIIRARRRLIFAQLASFKGPEFAATGLVDARAELRTLQAVAPADAEQVGADALINGIDESIARKMLITARWYARTGDPIAAELYIRRLVNRYPRSMATAEALIIMSDVTTELPPKLRERLPDYEALRRTILGDAPTNAEPARLANPPAGEIESPADNEQDAP